ncbi:5840_t:CDS:1, partial [Dentiscutata erythropus]
GKSEDNSSELYTFSFPDIFESWNTIVIESSIQAIAKAISYKQLIKGILLGLAYKYVKLVNYDNINDSNFLIETFKEWIHTYEELRYNNQAIEQILKQGLELEYNQVIEYKKNKQNFKHERNAKTTQLIVQNP